MKLFFIIIFFLPFLDTNAEKNNAINKYRFSKSNHNFHIDLHGDLGLSKFSNIPVNPIEEDISKNQGAKEAFVWWLNLILKPEILPPNDLINKELVLVSSDKSPNSKVKEDIAFLRYQFEDDTGFSQRLLISQTGKRLLIFIKTDNVLLTEAEALKIIRSLVNKTPLLDSKTIESSKIDHGFLLQRRRTGKFIPPKIENTRKCYFDMTLKSVQVYAKRNLITLVLNKFTVCDLSLAKTPPSDRWFEYRNDQWKYRGRGQWKFPKKTLKENDLTITEKKRPETLQKRLMKKLSQISKKENRLKEPKSRIEALTYLKNSLLKEIANGDIQGKEKNEIRKNLAIAFAQMVAKEQNPEVRQFILASVNSFVKSKLPKSPSEEELESMNEEVDSLIEKISQAYREEKDDVQTQIDRIADIHPSSYAFLFEHINDDKIPIELRRKMMNVVYIKRKPEALIFFLNVIKNNTDEKILRSALRGVEKIIAGNSIDRNGYLYSETNR